MRKKANERKEWKDLNNAQGDEWRESGKTEKGEEERKEGIII